MLLHTVTVIALLQLIKIQNEKKMENRELSEKVDSLTGEKLILQDEVVSLKETIQRKEGRY